MGFELKENFARNVFSHKMEIVQDDGVFRHIRFYNNEVRVYGFELTTWPGFLCIYSDMGCYVFGCERNMFLFFKSRDGCINPDLWATKIVSASDYGYYRKYSPEMFEKKIREYYDNLFDDKDSCWLVDVNNGLAKHVFNHSDEGEYAARKAMLDFRCGDFLIDIEELRNMDFSDYDYRFLWCLHAIVWGINRYYDGK